jgi:hypothetical protein
MALKTGGFEERAMQLNHVLSASSMMKLVNILGDDIQL